MSYNEKFQSSSNMMPVVSKVGTDESFQVLVAMRKESKSTYRKMSSDDESVDDFVQIFEDRGDGRHKKLALNLDDPIMHLKIRHKPRKLVGANSAWIDVFEHRINLLEVFGFISPENLTLEIIAPVFVL